MSTRAMAPLAGTDLADRRVLVIEDDPVVAEVARNYLVSAGFLVDSAVDSFAGLELFAKKKPDLVVLDRMLPGIDGVQVCKRIRMDSRVPIVMLTALGSTEDRIERLEAGADDYLVKPFSPRELVLRVRSVMSRAIEPFAPETPIEVGPFHLDPSARRILRNGEELALSGREFELFAFFLKHPRQSFDRQALLLAVWGWSIGDLSTVTVTARRLRERIERDPARPELLVTVWGVGYRLDVGEV